MPIVVSLRATLPSMRPSHRRAGSCEISPARVRHHVVRFRHMQSVSAFASASASNGSSSFPDVHVNEPLASTCTTSRSEIAVWNLGSQLTRRLSL